MTRSQLIEAEARRRTRIGGFDPEMLASQLSSFEGQNIPIWRVYAHQIETEIARLEAAGFVVEPRQAAQRGE